MTIKQIRKFERKAGLDTMTAEQREIWFKHVDPDFECGLEHAVWKTLNYYLNNNYIQDSTVIMCLEHLRALREKKHRCQKYLNHFGYHRKYIKEE